MRMDLSESTISSQGLPPKAVKTIALYIKTKLKKKVDIESIQALRGEEAVKFLNKYYGKALEHAKELEAKRAARVAEATQKNNEKYIANKQKLAEEAKKLEAIKQSGAQGNRSASEIWGDKAEVMAGQPKLIKIRLDFLAKHCNISFDQALKIATNSDLYNELTSRMLG